MTNQTNGDPYFFLSGSSAIFMWINLQPILTLLATAIAIVSGTLAVYCYIQKIKAKKW